ncbi:MAG: DNA polymerase III subunit beta [Firmicutes bacterium]|nr:DNA polymerase III subunit beta [Bacillota bacterium]
MRIEIPKEDLVYAVSAVERAVSGKNTLPILAGVMIIAKENMVTFRATDLELAIECTVSARVTEPGEIVAGGRKLSQLAKGMSGEDIVLETVGSENLVLRYSRGQISMPCYPTDEFPMLPRVQGDVAGAIPVKVFKRMVRQTGIAASPDELRPVFTGLMVEIKGGDITMVGTDTHRLTVGRGVWQGEGETSVIVPNKVLQEIARLAANDEDEIRIRISNNQIFFDFADLHISSRLIVGQFPDYQQVIPTEDSFTARVCFDKNELISSLELASVISREISRGRGNIVRLTLEEDKIAIHASSQEEGTFDESVAAAVDGEKLTLSYNARYLLDVLRVMDDDRIELRLTGATTPGVIQADTDDAADKDKFLYLVLPVRVSK